MPRIAMGCADYRSLGLDNAGQQKYVLRVALEA
jgi:hypothetical protein